MALKVSVFFCGDFHDGVIPLVAQLFDLKLGVGIPFEAALVASGSYTASRFFFFFLGGVLMTTPIGVVVNLVPTHLETTARWKHQGGRALTQGQVT